MNERVQQDPESRAASDERRYSEAERCAHDQVRRTYVERYHEGDAERGVPAGMVESEEEAEESEAVVVDVHRVGHVDGVDRVEADGVALRDDERRPVLGVERPWRGFLVDREHVGVAVPRTVAHVLAGERSVDPGVPVLERRKYSRLAGSYPAGSTRKMPYIPISMCRWVWYSGGDGFRARSPGSRLCESRPAGR